MSDNGIVWEDPPSPKLVTNPNGRPSAADTRRLEWLMSLAQRPGEWARVEEWPTALEAGYRARNLRKSTPIQRLGRFEFTSRTLELHGPGYIYARYLGPEKEAS